jgi:zinc transport system ATP-binding protein
MQMKNSSWLVKASGIEVNLNQRIILQGIDLEIAEDEIVTLIGPNGAGKTTLVRVMLGLLKPSSGKIERKPQLSIGYMPQKLHLPETLPLSVERFLRLSGFSDQQHYQQLVDELSIAHLLTSPMIKLSGGETQRVLLARALMQKPQLLVLDEPVQGVDVTGQAELYALIARLRKRYHCGILMISHDLHLVMATTDRVLCINRHLCCAGHPESVSQHPAYLELFGTPVSENLALYTHHHDHTHDIHGNVVEMDEDKDNG